MFINPLSYAFGFDEANISQISLALKFRAVAIALIGGGVYIHIFVLCPTNFF